MLAYCLDVHSDATFYIMLGLHLRLFSELWNQFRCGDFFDDIDLARAMLIFVQIFGCYKR